MTIEYAAPFLKGRTSEPYDSLQKVTPLEAGVFIFGGKHMDKETFIRILSAFLTKRLGKQVKETTFRKLGVTYTGLKISLSI